ncbi:MAG: arginine repressor [Bacteroidales bacterium]|nr:arginine repressor [Bacteroidales bacterium]
MKDRNNRLMTIRRMINSRNISSQEELLDMLRKQGFNMTQATLSRDLKYLKVAKMPDSDRGYIYMLAERNLNKPSGNDDISISGFVSIDFARDMAIMKTLPGHASSIAYAIDNMNSYEVAGTVAGDDTVLVIPRDGVAKKDILNLLKNRISGFNERMKN